MSLTSLIATGTKVWLDGVEAGELSEPSMAAERRNGHRVPGEKGGQVVMASG
jgi:hypothetical protein